MQSTEKSQPPELQFIRRGENWDFIWPEHQKKATTGLFKKKQK